MAGRGEVLAGKQAPECWAFAPAGRAVGTVDNEFPAGWQRSVPLQGRVWEGREGAKLGGEDSQGAVQAKDGVRWGQQAMLLKRIPFLCLKVLHGLHWSVPLGPLHGIREHVSFKETSGCFFCP